MTLLDLIQVILIILKLFGVINISWAWVFTPWILCFLAGFFHGLIEGREN